MVEGVRWFTWLDPVFYAFRALIPNQFVCDEAPCPTLLVPSSLGVRSVDRYQYVSGKYEVYAHDSLKNVGFLAVFILVFQVLGILATRYIRHIVR
jgi:hypothetical protein